MFPTCVHCGEYVEWIPKDYVLAGTPTGFWRHTAGWITCFEEQGKAFPGEIPQSVLL